MFRGQGSDARRHRTKITYRTRTCIKKPNKPQAKLEALLAEGSRCFQSTPELEELQTWYTEFSTWQRQVGDRR